MNIIVAIIIVNSCSSLSEGLDKNGEVQKLELEKTKLLKLIHEGMEDALASLKKNNDSSIIEGIVDVQKLKDAIQRVNVTDNIDKGNNTETRRATKNDPRKQMDVYLKKGLDLYTIAKAFNKQDSGKTAIKKKRREGMQERIEVILKQIREENRNKHRKMRLRKKFETCPNFGTKNGKKKKKGVEYPCCRKCCKKSYMGCL